MAPKCDGVTVQQATVIEYVDPATLKAHPHSVAIYGSDGYADLVPSIKELGVLQTLYCKRDRTVVSGHRRWRAALEARSAVVPVIWVSYGSEIDERQAIIEFNRYRIKNGLQLYNEGKEVEAIEAEKARPRMLAGKALNPTETFREGAEPAHGRHDRETSNIVAKTIGLGSGRQWDKLGYIAAHKPGLLPEIKPHGLSVDGAFRETRREVVKASAPTRPHEKALGVKLYWDDALERIPRLPEGSVALVIADPPYNVSEASWDQFPSPEEYLGWTERWLEALRPKLAPAYHLFLFCAPSYMACIEGLLLHQKWPLRSRVIWAYRNLSMGRDVADKFISSWQPVFHCGTHRLNWSPEWSEERLDVQIHASPQSNFQDKKEHPMAKPLKLIDLFVRIGSKPGDVVLDPFAGGGVTGEACYNVKQRSCVLIEKEETFVATIERRLDIRRASEGGSG